MRNSIQFVYAAPPPELPVMLLNCGHGVARSVQYRWDGRRRVRPGMDPELAIWQYTLAGGGALDRGGRTFRLEPGTAFLVTVPDDHVYYLPEGSLRWEFLYLTATGETMLKLTKELQKRFGAVCRHPSPSKAAERTLELIGRYGNGALPDCFTNSALAYELWMTIAAELGRQAASEAPQSLRDAVSDYLEKHREPVGSVGELAAALGYSRAHFTRKFTAECGISPGKFLTDWQLHLAMRILSSEREQIKNVAWQSGFADVSYFCRAFRRRYGVSPKVFQNAPELAQTEEMVANQLPKEA